MNTQNRTRMALHAAITGLVFCVVVGGFFHFAPVHDAPPAVIAVQSPAAQCLPSGTGGECIPFDKIQEMMNTQPEAPEVIPTNPATANEEKI